MVTRSSLQVCWTVIRRRVWGLSGRLIASYILVTLVVVLLVEALVLGFQVLPLVNGAQLQAQVDAYARELRPAARPALSRRRARRDRARRPCRAGTAGPGHDRPRTARWPFRRLPARSSGDQAITAVVAVGADGTVVASSAPSRYPPGRAWRPANSPTPATPANVASIKGNGAFAPYGTPYGSVLFVVSWPPGHGESASRRPARRDGSPTSMSRHRGRPGSSTRSAPGVSCASSARTGWLLLVPPAHCSSPSCRSACCSGC